ncbi:uncharacterized protein LOC126367763 [Pectinophora gossypiella]|uniref:uncharacterized protein LOC126367763 n=1 Tax=Pectinophora gossypiella TaxID=13191 RepID=UPI00214E601E|nr:uncharacterized protein LOC126367763 [Pectinophora gossypiella]
MVRNYKRKTDRGKWNEEDMRRAVAAVLTDRMGFLRASATYDVPKSTLERRVRKARETVNDDTDSDNDCGKKHLGRFKTVFTAEQENELAEYVKSMEARLFGLTGKELRIIAYQLAQRNHIDNPFNTETGMAGEDWLSGFLKRHPDLAYRRPEPTSAARAMGFNRVAVNNFFKLLENVIDKHKLTPERIYNVDETGISTVPKSQSKILSMKGQKQVGCLSSAERGQLVTAEICFNAVGTYVPPMLIYARKRMKEELLDDAPSGFWGTCSDNGWITTKIFFDWFKSFVQFAQPTKEKPILLLLDGHSSHTKNIDLIDYARENNVILLCTPPHCTHKLQPLDVSFMRPLSTYYSAEVKKWLRDHPGRVVTPYQVAKLFGQAYLTAATMLTAINGFRKCGIWPLDKNVFTDADFIAAETTNTENLAREELNMENAPSTSTSEPAITEENLSRPSPSVHLGQISSATQQNNVPSSVICSQAENSRGRTTSENQENIITNPNLQIDEGGGSEPLISSENAVHPVLSTEKEDIAEPATSFLNNNDALILLNSQIDISVTTTSSQNVAADADFNRYSPEIINTRRSPEKTLAEQPSTSTFRAKDKTPERQIKINFLVSPENIMAIPKEVRTQERKTRKRGKTAILTESPYKNELMKDISIKEGKNKKKTDNQVIQKRKKQMKKPGKKTAKKIKKTTDKENLQKKRQTKRCKNETESEDSSSQEEEDDCACIYCGYLYSDSTEGWVICGVCHGWAHNSCAGVDEEDEEAHICEHCLPD